MPSSSMSSTSYLQGEQRRRQRLMIALHHAGVATNGHVFLLVGGMVVADHLSQDPLLVALHALHPRRHLVSLFGYVVTARRGRPAQRRRAGEGGVTEKMLPQKVSRSTPEHRVQAGAARCSWREQKRHSADKRDVLVFKEKMPHHHRLT